MGTKTAEKSNKPAAVDPEKLREAAPALLAACEAMWTERFSILGGERTNYHSGWCGSDRYDPEPCKGTGKGICPCALWQLRTAFKKAGIPKPEAERKKA